MSDKSVFGKFIEAIINFFKYFLSKKKKPKE